ncbi:hypothetical protein LCL97_21415 [Seohaeicola saemankumensis]|nr:hypothetical protein [Seohaeicola saemankumensis]MCA0873399.1 hypothetical protein [Seohaeicola saemankumensis]
MTVLYIGSLGLLPGPAVAGEPYCDVTETCQGTSDNCAPSTGRLQIDVQPDGKALVRFDDRAPLQSAVLDMNGQIILIFHNGSQEHQLRISDSGRFNYLISTPDPEAAKGMDQVLYRGQCVEG